MFDGNAALRVVWPQPEQSGDFSNDQQLALAAIQDWRSGWPYAQQCFSLGGYAGTGKTTLVAYLSNQWERIAVAALCGKAANVLRNKGVEQAQTIHSLIYAAYEDITGKVRFRKRDQLNAADGNPIRVIVIDEASMVDEWVHNDLCSFGLPVLYVGDHGQLEPIGRDSGLMKNPDMRLENIHRQAEGNPILRLATAFRDGRDVPYWSDKEGRLRVVPRSEFDCYLYEGSQIICGFNKTRHAINKAIREARSFSSPLPCEGEKLICLRNNRTFGIFNGQQAKCVYRGPVRSATVDLDLELEDGRMVTLPCHRQQFGQDALKDHRDQNVALFDFGYCLTAHKAQGSEWDSVVVLEEISSRWDQRRWRYTVATRAKERLIYCG